MVNDFQQSSQQIRTQIGRIDADQHPQDIRLLRRLCQQTVVSRISNSRSHPAPGRSACFLQTSGLRWHFHPGGQSLVQEWIRSSICATLRRSSTSVKRHSKIFHQFFSIRGTSMPRRSRQTAISSLLMQAQQGSDFYGRWSHLPGADIEYFDCSAPTISQQAGCALDSAVIRARSDKSYP